MQLEFKIMRGCSGSGKSTKARELMQEWEKSMSTTNHGQIYRTSVICSTDDYFVDPDSGKYEFNDKLLHQAHSWNRGKVHQCMELGIGRIILDNTNTRKWEYAEFLKMAERFGYDVEEITIGQFDESNLKAYANRNRHGVPLDVIRKQAKRFER